MADLKVLVVDDEREFAEILAQRLEMRALDTRLALDGEEALKAVQEEEPDLMVLDLKLPGMDGMEVLRRVKEALPSVQVVILTGHGSPEHQKEARRLGAYAYLGKPVPLERLSEILRQAFVDRPRSRVDGGDEADPT